MIQNKYDLIIHKSTKIIDAHAVRPESISSRARQCIQLLRNKATVRILIRIRIKTTVFTRSADTFILFRDQI